MNLKNNYTALFILFSILAFATLCISENWNKQKQKKALQKIHNNTILRQTNENIKNAKTKLGYLKHLSTYNY